MRLELLRPRRVTSTVSGVLIYPFSGYSGGDDMDQGVENVGVFPCVRYRLGVCECAHTELVKASPNLRAQRPLRFLNESFAYAAQWHCDYI